MSFQNIFSPTASFTKYHVPCEIQFLENVISAAEKKANVIIEFSQNDFEITLNHSSICIPNFWRKKQQQQQNIQNIVQLKGLWTLNPVGIYWMAGQGNRKLIYTELLGHSIRTYTYLKGISLWNGINKVAGTATHA